jgi:flagellar biogenesis protein FliO
MFAVFQRHIARPKTASSDFTGAAQLLARWLSLPKRRTGRPSLQILESVPLTTHASIALVRFETENLVLAVTPQNVTVIARSAASGEGQTTRGNPIS